MDREWDFLVRIWDTSRELVCQQALCYHQNSLFEEEYHKKWEWIKY